VAAAGPDLPRSEGPSTLPCVGRGARIGIGIGLSLCALGLLVTAFVAYQLWGTALYEHQAQSHLKSELSQTLRRAIPAAAPAPSGTLTASSGDGQQLAGHTAVVLPQPALGEAVGEIWIPKIGIAQTIVQGVGDAQLEQGPGHYPGTPLPGEPGNAAIAGHRTTYAHPFYNLDALGTGDDIYVLTKQGYFRYTVTGSSVVAPTDVRVLATSGPQATLTLTTCNPRYSASTRLVVTAKFDGQSAAPSSSTQSRQPSQLAGDGSSQTLLGGSGTPVFPAILWALVTMVLVVIAALVFRRMGRRSMRVLVVMLAVPLAGASLLVCFEHVSLALPSSF